MSHAADNEHEQEYDDELIALLEAVWGDGFMSPGGSEEVDRIVSGLSLRGQRILDIGCGTGGSAVHLARSYSPSKVIGIDVEMGLIRRCEALAQRAGLEDCLDFRCVEPGPLALEDSSVDVVYSKDSIIHIGDKHALAKDVFRVLTPGGWFAASDWLAGYADQPTPEMQAYVSAEGLDFGLANVDVYTDALAAAGFVAITTDDRNAWYRQRAREERDNLTGPLSESLRTTVGQDFLDHQIDVWEKMIVALDQGQLRPTHLRAQKPG